MERLLLDLTKVGDDVDERTLVPSNHFPEVFLKSRKVQQVELSGPIPASSETDWSAWIHVEALRLRNVQIAGEWLYAMLKCSRPPLKHLEIKYAEQRPKHNNNKPGLDEDLRYCTDTLRALELEDLNDFVFLDLHLGSHQRLTCLPSMKAFTDLSIQTRYLFCSLEDMDGTSICERLPTSLQRLTLSEYWQHCGEENPWFLPGWHEQDIHTTAIYIDLMNICLVELANSNADRLPRLQWVRAI
jgi:hypothetical protein